MSVIHVFNLECVVYDTGGMINHNIWTWYIYNGITIITLYRTKLQILVSGKVFHE